MSDCLPYFFVIVINVLECLGNGLINLAEYYCHVHDWLWISIIEELCEITNYMPECSVMPMLK